MIYGMENNGIQAIIKIKSQTIIQQVANAISCYYIT